MRRPAAGAVFFGAFALAGVLTLADVRVARPASVTLAAPRADATVPNDPWASIWNRASAVQVPLSAQTTTRPIGGTNGMVTVRAMHNDTRLYVLLEWRDFTRDVSVGGPDRFADQAAVQFPTSRGDRVPFFCMGDPTATVNIWLWKASRQQDADRGYQDVSQVHRNAADDGYQFENDPTFYPPRALGNVVASTAVRPVENLIAGGFGSLTQSDGQEIDGVGRHRRNTWRVMFARDLKAPTPNQVELRVPESTSIGFAVWNGAAGERNGQKSVAQFVSLALSNEPLGEADGSRLVLGLTLAFGVLAALVLAGALVTRRGRSPAVAEV